MIEVMKIMVTSLKRSHARTVALSTPDPKVGHCRLTPLPETPGHSQASLGQSLVGSLLLSPGSWCSQVLFVPSKSLFPMSCVSPGGSMVGFMVTSPEGLCHSHVCCSQSPCLCGRPLLAHTSAGDAQRQVWLSLCGFSCCTQGFV